MMWFQIIILFLFVIGILKEFHDDVYGKPAVGPFGFQGILIDILEYSIMFGIYYGAGAFSQIFASSN